MEKISFTEFQNLNHEGFLKINKDILSLGIKWWAHSGTLLGVIREGGFLPWDDDIDMGMAIDDYLKHIDDFHKIAKKNGYLFADRFKHIGLSFARFIHKDKFIIEYDGKEYVSSPFIDIMIALPVKKESKFKFKLWEWRNKYFFLYSSFPPVLPKIDTRFGKVRKISFWKQIGVAIAQLLLLPTILLFYLQNYWIKKQSKKSYKDFVLFHNYSSRGFVYNKENLILKEISFKEQKIYISKDYLKELEFSFGKNWNQRPDEKHQIPHHIIYNKYNPKKIPKIYPHIVK